MAKGAKTVFVCGECGYESSKWLGRCPNCESWNTFVESAPVQQIKKGISSQRALPLREVQADAARRIPSGIGELDRVLGGGIVGGSAVLLGPGHRQIHAAYADGRLADQSGQRIICYGRRIRSAA